jgi:hypothetical protein
MLRKVLTLTAILACSIGFAQDAADAIDNRIIDGILANKKTCMMSCSEDRIYLNTSRLLPTEQGLYLNLNDADYVLLPTLNSDSNGCYLLCGGRVQPKRWQCPYCHRWWDLGEKCTNEECPTNQWKKE